MIACVLGCSDSEYYADTISKVPTLSQSIANVLLTRSPKHAWAIHPRLGNQRRETSADMDEGQLIHLLVLGKGASIEIHDVDAYRTNAAKEMRDAAIAAGKLPVKRKHFDEASVAAATILQNIKGFGIDLDRDMAEVAIMWAEGGLNGPVVCRAKLDHVNIQTGLILDIKKSQNAHPLAAARSVVNYGLALQRAAYTRALAALKPELQGRTDFMFLFCETSAPYEVLPARLDGAFRELGERQWLLAVKIWEQCLTTDVWPGYATTPATLECPPWALSQVEAQSNDT